MRIFTLPLTLMAAVGCSQAPPPPAPTPEESAIAATDLAVIQDLMARGAAALQAEQWSEAADYFSTAHTRMEASERDEAAFFWGYSLYKQGEALARENTRGDMDVHRQVLTVMEQARSVLELSRHPMRERVLEAIKAYMPLRISHLQRASAVLGSG